MDPEKAKKIVGVVISLPLFILGVGLVLGLPWWMMLAIAIITPVIIILIWLKPSLPRLKPAPTAPQAGKPPRDYLGWVKSSIWQIVIAVIAIGFFGSAIYCGILEAPDKVFSAEELLNYTVSGNCRTQGDELVCGGPWKIFIPDPDKKTIGKLTVVPGTEPFKEMMIQAGLYRVDYSQGDLKQFGGTVCGYAVKGVYHRAMIYYNGKPKIGNCYPVGVPTGQAPENLYFGTSWLRLLMPGFLNQEDPQFYVDWDIITRSYINDNPQMYLGGDITISSSQNARIKSVNVVYSRYRII